MTPQIRELYSQARERAQAATQLLAGDTVSPEQEARAAELLEESERLDQRAQRLEQAESLSNAGAEAFEAEERQQREDIRSRAAAAAAARQEAGSSGAQGVAANSSGETPVEEEEVRERPVTDRELEEFDEFRRALGGLVGELRERESPEASARRAAFRACLVSGYGGLSREERALVQTRATLELSNRSDDPSVREERAMGLGSAASLAILVPPEVQREARLATLAFGGWRNTRATFMPTNNGREIPIPTINDTSNMGFRRGEHEAIAEGKDVTANPNTLGAYLVRSGAFRVGYELAQDESFGLESLLIVLGTTRNERRQQLDWTIADGKSKPKGVLEGIETGFVAANPDEFEPADWFQFFESVDSSYHSLAETMLSNNALTQLKIMQGGLGTGLWQPGLAAGTPSQIDGHDYTVNFAMDTVASGNKPAIFGDLSWVYIREVVPTVIIRYAEKYAPDIGYEVVGRDDSKLVTPVASDTHTHVALRVERLKERYLRTVAARGTSTTIEYVIVIRTPRSRGCARRPAGRPPHSFGGFDSPTT